MRIGLASDSQGSLDALERALDAFVRLRVDRVFFLGGRLADLDAVLARRRGAPDAPVPRTDSEFLAAFEEALARHAATEPFAGRIVRVASRACPEYADGAAGCRKQMDLVEGRICCLVHDKAELTREDIGNATVLFHGNADRAALVQIGPRYFVTPGWLGARPGGADATFCVLEMTPADLALEVYSADGAALRTERASFAAGARMSVR